MNTVSLLNTLKTILIVASIVIGVSLFGVLLVASKMQAIHAVSATSNVNMNGVYFLIAGLTCITSFISYVIIKERHFN